MKDGIRTLEPANIWTFVSDEPCVHLVGLT